MALYSLTVPALVDLEPLFGAIVAKSSDLTDIQRAGAWTEGGKVVLLFRAASDEVATAAAEQLGGDTKGSTLHIGTGVHRRLVAEA